MNEIKISINGDESFIKELGYNLHKYNQNNCEFIKNNSNPKHNFKEIINFSVNVDGYFVGGASGKIQFGWYHLDQLWLDEKFRMSGIGSEIIRNIEKIAMDKNCFGIKTETWSFQAKDFYQKNGFEIYAKLDDFPPGSTEYHLKKIIKNKKGDEIDE